MAWIFSLSAECGPDPERAERLGNGFQGRFLLGLPFHAGRFRDAEGNWWGIAVLDLEHDDWRVPMATRGCLARLREEDLGFRYALAGVEVDEFRTMGELVPDLAAGLKVPGLVLSEAVWEAAGRPVGYAPFRRGYVWAPWDDGEAGRQELRRLTRGRYDELDETGRDRLHELALTLYREGDAGDRESALRFWAVVPPPGGVAEQLVDAYNHSQDEDLAPILGRELELPATAAARLADRFVRRPDPRVAAAVLRRFPTGATWEAFAYLADAAADAKALEALFPAALAAQRVVEFFTRLREKDRGVLREFAATLPEEWRLLLVARTGI